MQSQGSGVPESRYTMSYAHSALTGDTGADLYGHGPDSYVNVLQHQHQHIGGHGGSGLSPTNHGMGLNSPGHHQQKRSADVAGLNLKQDPMIGEVTMSTIGLGHGNMDDGSLGGQNGSPNKKTPPPNGKKTKGRVKIKMEFIDNKLRRYTTFSKRKTGIMKKAYELSTLTGTQVMLLVASETGHVYTFATRKLQPMITSEAGKALIQTCLNSPDPPSNTVDQRMSATGFEETELTYTLHDEDQKESDSGEEDDGGSSDASRSRSPSSADVEPSYSSEGSSEQGSRPLNASLKRLPSGGVAESAGSSLLQCARQQYHRRNINPPGGPNLAGLANLPGLSALTGLSLPHGANLASLLASASLPAGLSLLTSGATGVIGGGGGGVGATAKTNLGNSKHQETNAISCLARKNLPQLISLARLGSSLQPSSSTTKDTSNSALFPTNNQQQQICSSMNNALNLQTSRDKKGGGNKGRANTTTGKKKK